ncbi:hypothetical protein HGA64_01390, partial [Candidatus Falkowbacteria bacterium]|nr:hypothetical protein [Candidatus Falkowbacteria bacterium]
MAFNRKDYRAFAGTEIYFSKNDHRKMERARDNVTLVSTVCPDYPHDDGKYTFTGELGTGISLTAHSHLNRVPRLIEKLQEQGVEANWLILVADLPELTSKQTEFYTRVASSKDDYIARCESSAATIKAEAPQATEVKTFSSWYGKQGVPYLEMQEEVAER